MSDASATALPPAGRPWNPWVRAGFRLSFVYWALYLFMHDNVTVLLVIPKLQGWLAAPIRALAQAIGPPLFHLHGVAAHWHPTGSGDTPLDYVRIAIFAALAVVIGALWSLLDWKRPHYGLLAAWLRFLIRLTLGVGMVGYGLAKVFPLQMREPGFAVLNNTFGNSSPMTLLWTLIGLKPGYEAVCGAAELLAGILILYRRTATLGAIACAVVMTNVVLFNLFFDVPVKLYSLHLLAMSLYLLLPEAAALWRFFFLRRPAQLTGVFVPPASRRTFRIATVVIEGIFLVGFLIVGACQTAIAYSQHRQAMVPTELTGGWQIDSVVSQNPQAKPLSPEGDPWVAIYFEDRRSGFFRSQEGALWRCGFDYRPEQSRIGFHWVGHSASYRWNLRDPDHLSLHRTLGKDPVTIELHRLPVAPHYALLERKFSWVNDWGYER